MAGVTIVAKCGGNTAHNAKGGDSGSASASDSGYAASGGSEASGGAGGSAVVSGSASFGSGGLVASSGGAATAQAPDGLDWCTGARGGNGGLPANSDECYPYEYCAGEGCEGPGGSVRSSDDDCGVTLKPVCGCDGTSYTSAACARDRGVRIEHPGECSE